MCSVNADGEETEILQKFDNLEISDICRKCGSEGSKIILRKSDVYCNSCFLTYFVHKFRSTIGKSKQIKPKDKILIGFSGGPNSCALLHLIRQGLDEISHKKLRFDPSFIYINESALNREHCICVCSFVTDLNFKCYHVNFEEVFSPDDLRITEYTQDGDDQTKNSRYEGQLTEFLKKSCSSTSKDDAIDQLRNELICRTASVLGFPKVFLANNCTNLSVRILADVALGRGSQLASHVHFKTTHFGVEVYRPMRELLITEVDHYLELEKIDIPLKNEIINTNKISDSKPSIVTCTRNFLNELQRDFPSTIPTVFKIGDKLVSEGIDSRNSSILTSRNTSISEEIPSQECKLESETSSQDSLCIFCGFIKDTDVSSCSALEAVNISRFMSSLQPPNSIFQQIQEQKSHSIEDDIRKSLCYGCINLVKEMDNFEILPNRVKSDYYERRKVMQDRIQDCLL